MSIFREAREEITGDSWLDDLACASLLAAAAKFDQPDQGQESAAGTE